MFYNNLKSKSLLFSISIILAFFVFTSINAATLGEVKNFYVDPAYDISARQNISGQLILETGKIYFYIDSSWWSGFSAEVKNEMQNNLLALGDEFSNRIYPMLTSNYGYEPNPGVDNDPKIAVLFHQLKRGAGGYFNSGNEYSKYEVPASNEREMVYLNSDYLASPLLKRLLAHEFAHLITFNQKEKLNNIEEEVWLNEARAEYAITLCGYDAVYSGSNIQKRVVEFLKNPNDSLIDWQGIASDYGVLNIFIQYLVDQYGTKILSDSLKSNYSGIGSINYALTKYGYAEKFSDVFNDWTVAVLINDCSYGMKYCYKNPNLKNLKVIPILNSILSDSGSAVSVNYFSKSWAGHWDKITNAKGGLNFDFSGDKNGIFAVNYILCDKLNKCVIKSLALDSSQNGKISIDNFYDNYSSLIIVSFLKNTDNNSLQFSLGARAGGQTTIIDDNSGLLARIEELKKQISAIKAQLNAGKQKSPSFCEPLNVNLYFGLINNSDVSCLQQFLKNQGRDIYPEGLVTGNFYSKTKTAVIKFQEKYSSEILKPLGLSKGTGYVGISTRTKINNLLP